MSEQDRESASFELRLPMRVVVLATTALILGVLAFLYYETYKMQPPYEPGYPGDAFFPRLALGFSIIWAVIILGRVFLASAGAEGEDAHLRFHWPEFVSIVVFVYLYAVLLEPVGFEITTIVLMALLVVPRMRVAAPMGRALWMGLALSAATMLILYLGLVPMLNIPLPLKFLPVYIL